MHRFSGRQDVYLEIADTYAAYIERGIYPCGNRLPSVRTAAAELSVNPNTVAKAYAKLEQDGYIRTLPKKGVYVTWEGEGDAPVENADLAQIRAMRERGIDKQTMLNWIEEVYGNND